MSDERRKPLWVILAMGAALLAFAVVAILAAFYWWFGSQLDRRIAAIRAAGDPASIADLDPDPIPMDVNAAVILLGDQLDAFSRDHAAFFDTPLGRAYEKARSDGQAPSREQLAAIRTILDKHAPLAAVLARAAACPDYATLDDFSVDSRTFMDLQLMRIGQLRAASRYQRWQMESLLAAGDYDQAVQRGVEMLKLARLAEGEPLLVSFLVTIALRAGATDPLYDALASGPLPPELHAALDAELAQVDRPDRLSRALRTERAYSIDALKSLSQQSNTVTTGIARVLLSRQRNGVLDYYDAVLPVIDAPWHDKRSQVSSRANANYGVLATTLAPAVQAAYGAHNRDIAVQRCLRIFNALRQYAEANGREASDLAELKLPPAATIDPYSGQPLKLKHTPEGWIVYTVFENQIDDGGDLKQKKDYGVGPRTHRAK